MRVREEIQTETLPDVRGFAVRYAMDGEVGLTMFRQERPAIVVAGVMMPNVDGFSVTQRIRQTDTDMPILFLMARSQTTDVVRGFELGGNDYLKKTFSQVIFPDPTP
ncbi:hypothetical protein BH09BAC4_BH09BAC4_24500 [soil metagenome]